MALGPDDETRLARLEEWVSRKIGTRKEDQTAQDHIHEDLNPPADTTSTVSDSTVDGTVTTTETGEET